MLLSGCVEVHKSDGSVKTFLLGWKYSDLPPVNNPEDTFITPEIIIPPNVKTGTIQGTDVLLRPNPGMEELGVVKKLNNYEKVIIIDSIQLNSKDWSMALTKITFDALEDGETYEIDKNQKVKTIEQLAGKIEKLKVQVVIDGVKLTGIINKHLVREITNPKFYKIKSNTSEGWVFSELLIMP